MGITIGIDPGKDTGYAVLESGHLISCQLGLGNIFYGSDVWIELPQIYPHMGGVDPNDLIKVAVMVGEYKAEAERYGCTVHLIRPHDWKGNAPKSVTKRRMTAKYPDLMSRIEKYPEGKQHNIIDAIGIVDYGYAQTKARQK